MKIKSVSVENLGNIVRQMVNAALEDSDQITKLHQAIYEEWYFKKMMELGDATSKMENVKDIRKINQEISCPLSNLARNASDRDNSIDTSNKMKYLVKQDPDIKIIKHDESSTRDIPIMCNKSIEANVCTKYSERTCSEISQDHKRMINNNNAPSVEIIKVWNNPTQRAKMRKKLDSNITNHQNRNQNKGKLVKQVRRRLSFESWRKEKNLMYRKLLKEAEEKKQQELQKKLKDIEYKKASQEANTQIIKEKERKLSVKQLQVTQQINTETLRIQIDERGIINDQAFNVWKKQKDVKLKDVKLITTENVPYHQLKRSVGPWTTLTGRSSLQFDSWLDQLNNVLHQKYLRERRHLVRSFYCQPTYYGAVTTCYT